MDTAFVIGNGESRLIFPIQKLKGHGCIYGCNAIYRDHSDLCDFIVAVSPEMSQELYQAQQQKLISQKTEIMDYRKISAWDYVLPKDSEATRPRGASSYRYWAGSKDTPKSAKRIKIRDFSKTKGSGCSAVLMAAEHGHKDVVMLGFDILGSRQWELEDKDMSRLQNNVYKNTPNYPDRDSMKAYLKYEWLYQLTQIFRKFPKTNFYFINRLEYLFYNPLLIRYFCFAPNNVRAGKYADLKKYIEKVSPINWMIFRRNNLIRI